MQFFKKIYPFIAIIIIVSAVFFPYLNGYVGITPNVGTNDNVDQQTPFRQVLQESLKKGQFPLWEPRISAGFPLYAEGQIAALYPLNTAIALLPVPPYYSVTISIVVAIILSGINMYLFLGEFLRNKDEELSDQHRLMAFCGAVFWTQAGIMFNHTAHLNVLNIFTWLPFELYVIERRLNNKDTIPKSIALLSLPVGLQLLAGHPQFASYCLMFITLYWICNQFLITSKNRIKEFFVNGAVIGISIILGIMLGAIQLVPTLEFTANSTRQTGLDEEAINFLSFRIQDLFTFVSPFYDFSYEPRSLARLNQVSWPFDERYSYIGIIPLALALIAIAFIARKRQGIIIAGMGIFFLLLSLGNQSPIGILLKLPPLNLFRIPVKFTPFAQMAFIIVATVGLQGILNSISSRKKDHKENKNIGIFIAILLILTTLDTGSKLYTIYPIQKGEWWFEKPYTITLYEKEIQKEEEQNTIKQFDQRVFGQDYNVQMHKQYLEQDKKLWDEKQMQVFKNNRAILPAFDMLTYDVPLLDNAINSAGLKVKWYSDIEGKLFFAQPESRQDGLVEYPARYWDMQRLIGTKYILHNDNLYTDNAELIGKTNFSTGQDQVGLYKIKNPLPFIQAPKNIKYSDEENTGQILNNAEFNPATDIYIPSNIKNKININQNSEIKNVKYAQISNQQFAVSVETAGPAIILIRQAYFPGWVAKVDNSKTDTIRASHALQGIYISSPGKHTISMEYTPMSFKIGAGISIIAVISYLAILIADVVVNKQMIKAN